MAHCTKHTVRNVTMHLRPVNKHVSKEIYTQWTLIRLWCLKRLNIFSVARHLKRELTELPKQEVWYAC